MSQLFASGGQSIGASASETVLPMNIQGWFPLELTGLTSLLSNILSKSLLLKTHHHLKASFLQCSAFFMISSHIHMWLLEKPCVCVSVCVCLSTGKNMCVCVSVFFKDLCWQSAVVGQVPSLLFNKLSRFVIAFLPRSMCLLLSWLQSASAVILEPKKIKYVIASIFSPSICHEVKGQMPRS